MGRPLPEEQRQSCKVCKRRDHFDFHVSDDVWRAVVPALYRQLVVCLACFDRFANERGVDYAQDLKQLYFIGDRATFKFEVIWAMDSPEA